MAFEILQNPLKEPPNWRKPTSEEILARARGQYASSSPVALGGKPPGGPATGIEVETYGEKPAGALPPAAAPAATSAPGTEAAYAQAMLENGQADRDQQNQMSAATIRLQGGAEEQAALDKQMATADELRKTAMPEGRGYGGVFTAANPLEFVGSGIKQYKGWKERGKEAEVDADGNIVKPGSGILEKERGLRKTTNDARAEIVNALSALTNRKKRPTAAPDAELFNT